MQVTPAIHRLRIPFTIPVSDTLTVERFVNTFVITGTKLTLVDAGVAGSEDKIFTYIRSIGRDPSDIALLILTHSHPDHIGGALAIREATGCTVAAHAAEQAWIEDVNLQCMSRPVPGFHQMVKGSVHVDRVLEDGDVLQLGGGHDLDCVIFHTPGHSQGSISLLIRSGNVLITGDAVPVRGSLPVYDDVLASVRSIQRLMGIEGIRLLLSSWDEPCEGICAYQSMRDGLAFLQQVHTAVIRAGCGCVNDPMELCRRVAGTLDLPPQLATPLLARTFSAHLPLCNRPDLLHDNDSSSRPDGNKGSGDRAPKKLISGKPAETSER